MRNINQIVDNGDYICGMLEKIKRVCDLSENGFMSPEIADMLPQIISQMNQCLYAAPSIEIQKATLEKPIEGNELQLYVKELRQLIFEWTNSFLHQIECGSMDAMFWNLYDYFRLVDADTIYENAVGTFMRSSDEVKECFRRMYKFPWLQGRINDIEKDYSLIRVYAEMVKEHAEDFRWLYEKLADNRSKMILVKLAAYWFDYDLEWLSQFHENVFPDYFDLDIISCDENEVFVDCGAYVGDTIIDYIDMYGGKYKKIYAYEIIGETFEKLKDNTDGMTNIVYRQAGVSDKKGVMYIDDSIPEGGGARMAEKGTIPIDVVTLDEDIGEPVSVIKMDIEGAEMAALNGSRRHIEEEKPKLLISAYHRPGDIFDIPRLICEMREDYKIYLRFNGRVMWPADIVVFGI